MKSTSKPIKYGKPCMANLPPELGRSIIDTIMNTPPSDHTRMNREAARAERHLTKIAEEIRRNAVASN